MNETMLGDMCLSYAKVLDGVQAEADRLRLTGKPLCQQRHS